MKKSRKVVPGSQVSRSSQPRIAIAIMAAGRGTRLKSQIPKVLHEVGGRPLLGHVVAAAKRIVPSEDVYAIIGHEAERVRAVIASTGIRFVLQNEQRGTDAAGCVGDRFLPNMSACLTISSPRVDCSQHSIPWRSRLR